MVEVVMPERRQSDCAKSTRSWALTRCGVALRTPATLDPHELEPAAMVPVTEKPQGAGELGWSVGSGVAGWGFCDCEERSV